MMDNRMKGNAILHLDILNGVVRGAILWMIWILVLFLLLQLAGCTTAQNTNSESNMPQLAGVEQTNNPELESSNQEELVPMDSVSFYGATWQEAYENVLFSHPCTYLPNPAPQTNMEDRWIYLGIHDFDGDDIPELIIGDGAAVAVFTFADGEAQKLEVLDIPNYVWCVNGIFFGDNSISAKCDGSGGTNTVSFGFRDGRYVLGIYTEQSDAYDPPQINGKPATLEEMNRIYPVSYEDIPWEQQKLHIRLVNEDEQWVIYDMEGGKLVLSNPIDFNIFSWK